MRPWGIESVSRLARRVARRAKNTPPSDAMRQKRAVPTALARALSSNRADRAFPASVPTRTAWVLGFTTAFNQYGSKPERDVSGGKETEALMARIDDHCKRHPLDNLYNASARLVEDLRQGIPP